MGKVDTMYSGYKANLLQNAKYQMSHYPFEAENVLEFAEFAENSGGFRIY